MEALSYDLPLQLYTYIYIYVSMYLYIYMYISLYSFAASFLNGAVVFQWLKRAFIVTSTINFC